MQAKLSTLSDAHIVRLWYRIHDRIQAVYGSDPFGVDYSTLYYSQPGLAKAYMAVKAEGIRRKI